MGLLCASRRVHSIFMLRCFNDCVATTVGYLAVFLLVKDQKIFFLMVYCLALSVKMSILLLLPGAAIVLMWRVGSFDTIAGILFLVWGQISMGLPFIMKSASAYIYNAFNFQRIFLLKWSVNW